MSKIVYIDWGKEQSPITIDISEFRQEPTPHVKNCICKDCKRLCNARNEKFNPFLEGKSDTDN